MWIVLHLTNNDINNELLCSVQLSINIIFYLLKMQLLAQPENEFCRRCIYRTDKVILLICPDVEVCQAKEINSAVRVTRLTHSLPLGYHQGLQMGMNY